MLPIGIAIGDELLEDRETDFAVVQRVAEVAAFEDPGGRNPAQRQPGELLDVVGAARARIGQDGDVRLLSRSRISREWRGRLRRCSRRRRNRISPPGLSFTILRPAAAL